MLKWAQKLEQNYPEFVRKTRYDCHIIYYTIDKPDTEEQKLTENNKLQLKALERERERFGRDLVLLNAKAERHR